MFIKQNIYVLPLIFMVLFIMMGIMFVSLTKATATKGYSSVFTRFLPFLLGTLSVFVICIDILGCSWKAELIIRPATMSFAPPSNTDAEELRVQSRLSELREEKLTTFKRFRFADGSNGGTGSGDSYISWFYDGFPTIARGVYLHPFAVILLFFVWITSIGVLMAINPKQKGMGD
jgi:hypothetical protein